ncbi:MAG: glycosyltransferase family 39 protein [Candidatus Gracilibacteria bacterium]|nr:glycosyltransferase family 39 protein [Candidatus Gracilibacteria bacterium]
MKKIIFYIILLFIFIYGVYIRYYELGTGSFWIDEGYSSIVSYFSYLNNFIPFLPNDKYDFGNYIFTFLQNISFKNFGISDYSARIPSFVLGILNMIIYFIFSKELLKNNKHKNIALLFMMFLFTFSTWQIIWSREARFYELLSFIYLSNTYLLWKYSLNNDFKYYLWFLVLTLIGVIFHPFCFGFFIVGLILFIYKIIKEREKNKYISLFGLIIVLLIYGIIDLGFKYISIKNLNITNSIPLLNSLGDFNYITYLYFYIESIYNQLGIIFISYIIGIGYYIYKGKVVEFIIFGLLIIINILFISYGYMAHTRYMFHLYSIITLIGGYSIINIIGYLLDDYIGKFKKSLIIITIIVSIVGIYKSYNLTILAQRFYYIDYTSPKPNFKMAYSYLEKNHPKSFIVSGFPHLCYWYNLKNVDICKYGIKINLTGSKNLDKNIIDAKYENYTNISYLNDIKEIDNIEKYYFVLDDLTIKNSLNKQFINNIINNCQLIYKDIGNNEPSNFLGIWHCK